MTLVPCLLLAAATAQDPAAKSLVVVAQDVRLEERVEGDVVVLLGDAELLPGAVVTGDVVVVGGSLRLRGGKVLGRPVCLGGEVEGARQKGRPWLRLGFWVLVATFLMVFFPSWVRGSGSWAQRAWGRALGAGIAFMACWTATVFLTVLLLPSPWAGAAVTFLAFAAFVAKVLGVAGISFVLGSWLKRFLPFPLRGHIPRTGLGSALAVGLSFVPWGGTFLWMGLSLWGVGAGLLFAAEKAKITAVRFPQADVVPP